MAVNKVVFGEDTLIDISDSTVTTDGLLEGLSAYNAAGEKITGVLPKMVVDIQMSDTSENVVQNKTIKEYVDTADANLQSQIDALGEPFRLKNWASNALNVEIPCCTEDLSNVSIAKMIFSIDAEEGADFQIAGMIAYEVFDSESGGNRINCWPVCQFTGNGQKELSVRWMCGGTSRKTAKRINAWVLLKHR